MDIKSKLSCYLEAIQMWRVLKHCGIRTVQMVKGGDEISVRNGLTLATGWTKYFQMLTQFK